MNRPITTLTDSLNCTNKCLKALVYHSNSWGCFSFISPHIPPLPPPHSSDLFRRNCRGTFWSSLKSFLWGTLFELLSIFVDRIFFLMFFFSIVIAVTDHIVPVLSAVLVYATELLSFTFDSSRNAQL